MFRRKRTCIATRSGKRPTAHVHWRDGRARSGSGRQVALQVARGGWQVLAGCVVVARRTHRSRLARTRQNLKTRLGFDLTCKREKAGESNAKENRTHLARSTRHDDVIERRRGGKLAGREERRVFDCGVCTRLTVRLLRRAHRSRR